MLSQFALEMKKTQRRCATRTANNDFTSTESFKPTNRYSLRTRPISTKRPEELTTAFSVATSRIPYGTDACASSSLTCKIAKSRAPAGELPSRYFLRRSPTKRDADDVESRFFDRLRSKPFEKKVSRNGKDLHSKNSASIAEPQVTHKYLLRPREQRFGLTTWDNVKTLITVVSKRSRKRQSVSPAEQKSTPTHTSPTTSALEIHELPLTPILMPYIAAAEWVPTTSSPRELPKSILRNRPSNDAIIATAPESSSRTRTLLSRKSSIQKSTFSYASDPSLRTARDKSFSTNKLPSSTAFAESTSHLNRSVAKKRTLLPTRSAPVVAFSGKCKI